MILLLLHIYVAYSIFLKERVNDIYGCCATIQQTLSDAIKISKEPANISNAGSDTATAVAINTITQVASRIRE